MMMRKEKEDVERGGKENDNHVGKHIYLVC